MSYWTKTKSKLPPESGWYPVVTQKLGYWKNEAKKRGWVEAPSRPVFVAWIDVTHDCERIAEDENGDDIIINPFSTMEIWYDSKRVEDEILYWGPQVEIEAAPA